MQLIILFICFILAYKTLTVKPKVLYRETVLDKHVFSCDFVARSESDLEYRVTWHAGDKMEDADNVTVVNGTGSARWMVDLDGIKNGVRF